MAYRRQRLTEGQEQHLPNGTCHTSDVLLSVCTDLSHSCLEGLEQGTPLAALCILGHPTKKVLIVSLSPSPPYKVLEGLQQREQSISGLYWLEAAYEI